MQCVQDIEVTWQLCHLLRSSLCQVDPFLHGHLQAPRAKSLGQPQGSKSKQYKETILHILDIYRAEAPTQHTFGVTYVSKGM